MCSFGRTLSKIDGIEVDFNSEMFGNRRRLDANVEMLDLASFIPMYLLLLTSVTPARKSSLWQDLLPLLSGECSFKL